MTKSRKRGFYPVARGSLGPQRKPKTDEQRHQEEEDEINQRIAANWARWEGQERFGDDR